MSDHEAIRQSVSKTYARAVSSPGGGGCCGGAPVTKGEAAKLAGYSSEELRELPAEAVVNAFGCGNPVAFSEIQAGQVVLDLGSGAGIDLLLAAAKVGPEGRVIGVDMTDEMLAKARQNVQQAGVSNVELRKGIIEQLPVDDASVDWVISNCVINLSPDKPRVFAEVARVLKPGGHMLVSDIVVQDLPGWIRDSAELYSACVAGAISEQDYVSGLEAAGLEQVEVRHRLVYDRDQLLGLLVSELSQGESSCCCGPSQLSREQLEPVLAQVEGKIWSARVFARKPG